MFPSIQKSWQLLPVNLTENMIFFKTIVGFLKKMFFDIKGGICFIEIEDHT